MDFGGAVYPHETTGCATYDIATAEKSTSTSWDHPTHPFLTLSHGFEFRPARDWGTLQTKRYLKVHKEVNREQKTSTSKNA